MPKKPIDHYEHPDTLPNNPTQELSGFAEEEYAPTRYPRDTALDPQLVWKGKDQQNEDDLEVHTVPIYTQEHIQPQAIIENLRAQKRRESDQTEILFEGFDNLNFEEKIEFYQHEQNWHNRFILGDSLVVMNSLAEKEHLKRSVQMIYIDPPYGVKFKSNWQVSTRKREVEDVEADVTPQPEQVKAYRDTWNFGIHSYLAYLRDRLTAAHELLTDSGSVFVQISEKNVHQVRCLLDEVFDDTNFVATITVARGNTTSSTGFPLVADYLLWYAKSKDEMKYRQLYMKRDERTPDPLLKSYTQVELEDGTRRGMTRQEIENPALLPQGSRRFANYHLTSQSSGNEVPPAHKFEGKVFTTTGGRSWSASLNGLERLGKQGRLRGPGKVLYYIKYASDLPGRAIANVWTDTVGSSGKIYAVQTNTKVVQRCMLMTTDPGDLVLDPTCGSGTTAYVAEQWGRRWITVDTSRVSLALARTRLMTAKYPYYCLEDAEDIKKGFIYKVAAEINLTDMANNSEIDDIHAKYAEKLDPLRAEMNCLIEQNWEEWEVPIETNSEWNAELQNMHQGWLSLKKERQREMDASTALCGKNETFYDDPYEDKKQVRVTGPFTVESLSPPFALNLSEAEDTTPTPLSPEISQNYYRHILEHIKTAGLQNRSKGYDITFDWLEEFPGEWLHAEGACTNDNGKTQSIAISIGPQYDTVGRQWINESAKEAARRTPNFDLLIVVGFNFAGYTAGEDMRMGSLAILPIKMSHELMVRELKNTGEGNLFIVFGEPDVDIVDHKDGTLSVKLLGVDVYDPKSGLIRSNTPEDIACWFIDTSYTGEAFFVRHAYFTGTNEPYKQLQRALNSEIDEEMWEALYRTESLPFPKPETGKIGVKVINHHGDEVMKEYRV